MRFQSKSIILITLGICLLLLSASLLGLDTITIAIMQHHHASLDIAMRYLTIWAEWPVILIAISLSLITYGNKGWLWAVAFLVEGVLIQMAKKWINWPRPAIKFPESVRSIEGITLAKWSAFPSGHTAAAFFATAIILSLWQEKWSIWIKYFLVLLAFAVAYSRIYLGQHSIEDVLVGMLAGIWLFWCFHWLFEQKQWLRR